VSEYLIIVVEDEVMVRIVIADALRNAGYTVIEASSANEALEMLRSVGVDVRLVFSDVRMPGTMDGIGLAHAVRSEFPTIKIVLTSGNPTDLDLVDHDGFFPKPHNATKIIRYVKTLLGTEERSSGLAR
jgi:CheY-like chemotaxis protein